METVKIVEMETNGDVLHCPFNPEDRDSEVGLVVSRVKNDLEISIRDAAKTFGVSEIFVEEILGAFQVFAYQVQEDLKSVWNRLDRIEGKK